MSGEGLVAVLRAHLPRDRHNDDTDRPETYCGCGGWEGDYFADGEAGPFDEHLADAIAAHLAEVLGGDDIWQAVWHRIAELRDAKPRTTDDADSGEIADAVLGVVGAALGVQEALGADLRASEPDSAQGEDREDDGRCTACDWVDPPRRICETAVEMEQVRGRPCEDHCDHPEWLRAEVERHPFPICGQCGKRFPKITNHDDGPRA